MGTVKTRMLRSFVFVAMWIWCSILMNQCMAINPIDGSNREIEKLPFCGQDGRDVSRGLLFVSTLDGKVSALDLANGGLLKWSINTAPGGLLSSSIHRLELTNNGQWVRMIPSLSGGLYKFDGETIEPIPVSADHLLSASYKFSDDLVVSGGKETRTYGISTRTGKIVYECSMHGCINSTTIDIDQFGDGASSLEIHNEQTDNNDYDPLVDEIIVVRRQTQTVRAIEPRTGGERWNFSVGHHEMDLMKSETCHERPYVELDKAILNIQLKVIVPEGIVCAVQMDNPNIILWQYKFDHPIVSAWRNGGNDVLQNVDLFSYSHWPWNVNEMPENYDNLSPSIYVGMFNKQLYIQESTELRKIIRTNYYLNEYRDNEMMALKVPWKPMAATSSGLVLLQNNNGESNANTEEPSVTALSVLYGSEYVNGNGYFLFSSDDLNKTQRGHCNRENETINYSLDEKSFKYQYIMADTPFKIIIVSLWWWWKQIIICSLVTALVLNIFLSRRMPSHREVVIVERHVEVKVPVVVSSSSITDTCNERNPQRSISESSSISNFTSRFATDFDLIQRLGKGGFGVVFEARDKLDDCNYAIKRIVLPNQKESRDRVLREVKTLAHCEHQHIVRYFHAWIETPPAGWQENADQLWINKNEFSHSIDIPSPSDTKPKEVINEVITKKNKELNLWISNLNTNECINFDESNRKTKFADNYKNYVDDNDDDDDSFIQFKNSTTGGQNDDSVFNRKKTNGSQSNHHNSRHFDYNSNSSFEIEFKHSSNGHSNKWTSDGNITNGDITNSNTNTNSCFIDLNHTLDDKRKKQRTQSESKSRTAEHIISISDQSSLNDGNALKPIQFKKTHRRPLSLDLTQNNRRSIAFVPPRPSKEFLYIKMQLCKKQSLKEWIRETDRKMRQSEAVPIFRQIVDAVEYVHMKGLIHRDLKPSNIFFSLDGQIKIGDFGLVTDIPVIDSAPCESKSHGKQTQNVGTYSYMSPEQLLGQHYNYKVDIYSLGLIFFELLVVFSTDMERAETLKALRLNKFPDNFCTSFPNEYRLLTIMLSNLPKERPTTIGIRARPPLGDGLLSGSREWDFELPPRRRDSHLSGVSSNHSI